MVGAASGGAIQIHSAEGVITNCIFKGNKANGRGGAIAIGADTSGPCDDATGYCTTTITGTVFEENEAGAGGTTTASYGGSAIMIGLPNAFKVHVDIRESSFKNNDDKTNDGGTIYTSAKSKDSAAITWTLVNSEFIGSEDAVTGIDYKTTANVYDVKPSIIAPSACSDSPCSEDPFTSTCADLSDNKGITCDCASGTLEPLTYGSTTCCDPVGCSASSGGDGGGGGGAPACPAGQYPKPQQFYVAVGNLSLIHI